jgi:hypothetical protein
MNRQVAKNTKHFLFPIAYLEERILKSEIGNRKSATSRSWRLRSSNRLNREGAKSAKEFKGLAPSPVTGVFSRRGSFVDQSRASQAARLTGKRNPLFLPWRSWTSASSVEPRHGGSNPSRSIFPT